MDLNVLKLEDMKSVRVVNNYPSDWPAGPEQVLEGALWLEVLAKCLAKLYLAESQETPDVFGKLRAGLDQSERMFAMKWALRLQSLTTVTEGAEARQLRPQLSRMLAFEHLMNCAETVLAIEKVFVRQGHHEKIGTAHSAALICVWESKAESLCAQYNFQIAPKAAGRLPALDFETLRTREALNQFGRYFEELSAYEKVKVYGSITQVAQALLQVESQAEE